MPPARHRLSLWFPLLMLLLTGAVRAETDCRPVARLVSAEGEVTWRRQPTAPWRPARPGQQFCQGDSLATGAHSRAGVRIGVNQTEFRIAPDSVVTFTDVAPGRPTLLDLLHGILHFISRTPRSLEVHTPFLNAAIEGTEFVVAADGRRGRVAVFEGRVRVSNAAGSVAAEPGDVVAAAAGQAPRPVLRARPADSVQWALYYPPIVDTALLDVAAAAAPQALEQAVADYRRGDTRAALADLDGVPADRRDGPWHLLRAALLLDVGEVHAAAPELAAAAPAPAADALRALVAVVQNDLPRAGRHLTAAQAAAPDNALVAVVRGYLLQARGDIAGAIAATRRATTLAPDSGIALARLAELQQMTADRRAALRNARRAVALAPHLAHARSVLGFAALDAMALDDALGAFEQAMRLDPAAPLPHLGRGLVRIRRGRLAAGREDIEIAVLLDPGRAMLRSYLGKAYFDELREALAADQFLLAHQLDPNDPTPLFYDALRLQAENHPVAALRQLDASLARNGRRAVYRSERLLSRDSAARLAAQGRIFADLGFQPLAERQAEQALARDPANAAAHRQLADAYLARPDRDFARKSELLQAQLLQPLNRQPLQPQVSGGRLGLLSGAGPADLGYGEYNPLFTRSGVSGQLEASVAERGIWADDLIVNALGERAALGLGQYHQSYGGFRPGDDFGRELGRLLGQWAVTADTHLQLAYSDDRGQKGNLVERLLPELEENADLDFHTHVRTTRLGGRHQFASGDLLLANLIYQDVDTDFTQRFAPPASRSMDTESGSVARQGELQYLGRLGGSRLVAGGGAVQLDAHDRLHLDFSPMPCPFPVGCDIDNQIRITQRDLYAYLYNSPRPDLDLTLGLAWHRHADEKFDQTSHKLDPKLGLIWHASDRLDLRAAAFAQFTRLLPSSQTVEPTQIAGFSQLFDDPVAARTENTALGLDFTLSERLTGGIEGLHHAVEMPYVHARTNSLERTDFRINRASAWLNWTPRDDLAVNPRLSWFSFKAGTPADRLFQIDDLHTWQLGLDLRWFRGRRWILAMENHYIAQSGHFFLFPTDNAPRLRGDDHFFLTDVSATYRLAHRRGHLSLGIKNLWDTHFDFEDTDAFDLADNPLLTAAPGRFSPDRLLFVKLSLNLGE